MTRPKGVNVGRAISTSTKRGLAGNMATDLESHRQGKDLSAGFNQKGENHEGLRMVLHRNIDTGRGQSL